MSIWVILAAVSVLVPISAAFDKSDCIIDAALVIDNSGSITNNGEFMKNWDFVVKFAQDITKGINIGPSKSRIGLVDFHSYATIHFGMDVYPEESQAVKAVGELPYEGYNTNTPQGLEYGRDVLTNPELGAREGVPKVMFLITDGEPSDKYAAGLDEEIQKTKEAGIRIIAIGVTDGVKPETLHHLASTDDDVYIVQDFNDLDKITSSILNDETCKPPPPPPTRPTTPPSTTRQPSPPVIVDENILIASCSAI